MYYYIANVDQKSSTTQRQVIIAHFYPINIHIQINVI